MGDTLFRVLNDFSGVTDIADEQQKLAALSLQFAIIAKVVICGGCFEIDGKRRIYPLEVEFYRALSVKGFLSYFNVMKNRTLSILLFVASLCAITTSAFAEPEEGFYEKHDIRRSSEPLLLARTCNRNDGALLPSLPQSRRG